MKIYILLATYNGSAFLHSTLTSLLSQRISVPYTLQILVSDDASSDASVEIVQTYPSDQVQLISIDRKGGAVHNFKYLIDHCPLDGDLYFFADQDDVWMSDKIELFLEQYRIATVAHFVEKPMLIFSDLTVTDQDLNIQYVSLFRECNHHSHPAFPELMVQNPVVGCAMAVNRRAIELARMMNFESVIMHDWLLALLCSALGTLTYIDRPTVFYRQHQHNEIGAVKRTSRTFLQHPQMLWQYILTSCEFWRKNRMQLIALHHFCEEKSFPAPSELTFLVTSFHGSAWMRFIGFSCKGIRKYGWRRNIIFFCLYLLNWPNIKSWPARSHA